MSLEDHIKAHILHNGTMDIGTYRNDVLGRAEYGCYW